LTNSQVQRQKPSSSYLDYCKGKDEFNLVVSMNQMPYLTEREYTESLIDVLANWRWMAGVNVANQDENDVAKELILIAQFIKNNYPKLTVDEIRLSIDLSLTDKLDVDVRTFNTFSPMYVSRILNAFLEYKRTVFSEVKARKELADDRKKMEMNPTPEEKKQSMIELIAYFYAKYKEHGFINDYFSTVYLFFKRTGILKLDKELIEKALEYGKHMANKEANDFMSLMDKGKDKTDKEVLQKRFARNYAVQDFFEKTPLEVILSKINVNQFF